MLIFLPLMFKLYIHQVLFNCCWSFSCPLFIFLILSSIIHSHCVILFTDTDQCVCPSLLYLCLQRTFGCPTLVCTVSRCCCSIWALVFLFLLFFMKLVTLWTYTHICSFCWRIQFWMYQLQRRYDIKLTLFTWGQSYYCWWKGVQVMHIGPYLMD
jgi:hypothetical protein